MLDKKKLKNKILVRLLTSPFTIIPFIVGITLLMAFVTFSRKMGITLFAGITCLLGSCASFFTQLIMGGERISQRALEDIRKKAQKRKEEALNALDRQLSADGDPRSEGYLRDLRAIFKAFSEKHEALHGANVQMLFDVVSGIDQLFQECVNSLKQTLNILRLANQVGTEKTRRALLAQREQIINDVGKSIDHLSKILQDFQGIGTKDQVNTRLAQIRSELDQSLEIAKAVDQRLSQLGKTSLTQEEKYISDFKLPE